MDVRSAFRNIWIISPFVCLSVLPAPTGLAMHDRPSRSADRPSLIRHRHSYGRKGDDPCAREPVLHLITFWVTLTTCSRGSRWYDGSPARLSKVEARVAGMGQGLIDRVQPERERRGERGRGRVQGREKPSVSGGGQKEMPGCVAFIDEFSHERLRRRRVSGSNPP